MAHRKTPNIPVFSIGSEKEFYQICRKMISESGMTFTPSSVRRFYRICLELNIVQHPWAQIEHHPQVRDLIYSEKSCHSNLMYLWLQAAFKRLCDWLTEETGKLVDVLGSFQSEIFIKYFCALSRDERQMFVQALAYRKSRLLFEEFGIRTPEDYTWEVFESDLRNIESPRNRLKFLVGLAWWEGYNDKKKMPQAVRDKLNRDWCIAEMRGEIGHYPPPELLPMIFNIIPNDETFQPLREFLNQFEIRYGKIVWTLSVKELARLIDRLFWTTPNDNPLIYPLPHRFKRATEWFVGSEKPLKARSLMQSASSMNSPNPQLSVPPNIEDLCNRIRASIQTSPNNPQ